MSKKYTGLISGIEQRPVGPTHSSFRSLLQLRTPSGPQYVESSLESELVEQLNFSPHVSDLITQPIIKFVSAGRDRKYACDIFIQLSPGDQDQPLYYLLEVKRAEDLAKNKAAYAEKFRAAEDWCRENFAEFRVLLEKDIRTPYLANARLFNRHYNYFPENRLLSEIEDALSEGPTPVAEVIQHLHKRGTDLTVARLAIEQAVANWLVACDLSQPFTDSSLLSEGDQEQAILGENQPILKTIRNAKNW